MNMASKTHKISSYARAGGSELFLKERQRPNMNRGGAASAKIPNITSRKIRERLVHLLAFKAYTRIELNEILKREGSQECERRVMTTVLKDIAQLRHNTYSLRPRMWKEVDENWPYVTKEEQQQLKWFKEQNSRPPNSSDEVTSVSSCSPPQLEESDRLRAGDTLKRPCENNYVPQPTKQRKTEHTIDNKCLDKEDTYAKQPAIHAPASTNAAQLDNYDFSDYTEITNGAQRQQYKAAFDRDYEEYIILFQQIGELERSFGELGGMYLTALSNGSDRQSITKRIVASHNIISSQEGCMRQQRRDYLHAKLAHIKNLITVYDSKCAKEVALAMPKQHELMQERVNAEIVASTMQFPPAKNEGVSDFLGTDLAKIAEPDENPIINGYATTATTMQFPPAKNADILDFLGTDLALSESDSDDD
ncbi:RNA polymerase II elongation factor Ell-like [Bactrocera dorsalis]|uniref:RNA polymerase II elongation factor Ell-like n=1 Tax=Bactrocera dorsalis TaxID=27457 RepID=A0ABM3J7U7_BACDO|nr:RNA polymerase II elongation factor Ell-like [Bactrocera dorsalis]